MTKTVPRWHSAALGVLLGGAALALAACSQDKANGDGDTATGTVELLNVSYDPTRELYEEINPRCASTTGPPASMAHSAGTISARPASALK